MIYLLNKIIICKRGDAYNRASFFMLKNIKNNQQKFCFIKK